MDRPLKPVIEMLLKQYGAPEPVRTRTHAVYRIPGYGQFVFARTLSDSRSDLNALTQLKHLLGIKKTGKKKVMLTLTKQPKKRVKAKQKPKPVKLGQRDAKLDKKHAKSLAILVSTQPKPKVEEEPEEVVFAKPRKARTKKEVAVVYTYPPEVLAEATRILNEKGTRAYNEFLTKSREEVVEVIPGKRTKTLETPNVLEISAKGAEELKKDMERSIAHCNERIEHAHEIIRIAEIEKAESEDRLKKATSFLDSYSVMIAESEAIQPFLASQKKVEIELVQQRSCRVTGSGPTTKRSPKTGLPSKILGLIMPMFDQPKAQVSVMDMIRFVAEEHEMTDIKKTIFYTAIQSAKTKGLIESVPNLSGVYRKAGSGKD